MLQGGAIDLCLPEFASWLPEKPVRQQVQQIANI